jgi:hypothetical protein
MAATAAMLMPANSWAFCSEPSAPFCAESYGPFNDQWDFDNCKREMESYKSEIEDYLECNRNEVEEANEKVRRAQQEAEEAFSKAKMDNDHALSEYNDAVESFNRRAGG